MKKVSAVLLGFFAALTAWAQTNTAAITTNTVPSATNAPVTVTNAIPTMTNALEQSVSLDAVIAEALQHNFDVQIERYNPEIALYDLRIGYAAYDPEFSFSGEHDYSKERGNIAASAPATRSDGETFISELNGGLPFGTSYKLHGDAGGSRVGSTNFLSSGGGQAYFTLTQPLLKNFWIDRNRLTILVAKNRLKYSEQGLRFRLISVVTSVEQAYYDLIAARENVKVQRAAMELADRLLAENKKRVEVGTMAPLDEKQAESQVASSRADLISAERALTAQENVFKSIISDDYRRIHDTEYVPVESLAAPVQNFDLQKSWTAGMTLRPDLLQVRLDLERQGIQLKYDRNQLFPELDVFGTYGQGANSGDVVSYGDTFDQIGSGDRPFYNYGAKITVPLSNASARNAYKQTKLTVKQATLALKQFEQNVLIQIDDAIKQAQSDYQSVQATRAAREYAEAALDAEQKKLASGKSTSFVVLQLQKDLTTARSAEISALASYNKSLAAIAQAEGTTLERRGINIEVEK